ncbi:hypothetical protein FCL47_18465 [Desulfopila sp. IMCC35006]|uniref:hypothetical protein n=1 Tax=Desulfopila sp. IMCC35006 TaxID=2569542 RepID=UPI0010ACB59D|nr:hypothetical protein [Desulfopila sp. IMCC35006]TKB24466.1 hypothetical protein FCL47_18465 [Desulfopila sp. IMCC35006]
MNTPIITKDKIQVDLSDEIMGFTLKAGIALCCLIGIWGVACIVGGMMSSGPLAMLRGYLTAITGV